MSSYIRILTRVAAVYGITDVTGVEANTDYSVAGVLFLEIKNYN
jgi:hypothetical protein